MHHLLLGAADGQLVDHINDDPLDNRRANLRIVTPQQNVQNKRPSSCSLTGINGVRGTSAAAGIMLASDARAFGTTGVLRRGKDGCSRLRCGGQDALWGVCAGTNPEKETQRSVACLVAEKLARRGLKVEPCAE